MANTVIGKAYLNIRDEKLAGGTITPGMLVERNSSDAVVAHSTAGGAAQKLFAVEDDKQGRPQTTNYTSGELVQLWAPVPGERVYAILDDATGTVSVIGDFLQSAGDGRLKPAEPLLSSAGVPEFPNAIVAVALAAAVAGARVLVEIV